jgi:hypothetical protein
MAQTIQGNIDALSEPCTVLIGYGLCGNGLVGLKSRQHTLVIPRTDDCIALLLGSYESYIREISETPGTYYLTRGWIESGSDPLREYEECCATYGTAKADFVMDAQYRNYRRLCLVAYSREDLDACRERAMQVAAFGAGRWGWRYEERLGSDALVRDLLEFGTGPGKGNLVVIAPGGEVTQDRFLVRD